MSIFSSVGSHSCMLSFDTTGICILSLQDIKCFVCVDEFVLYVLVYHRHTNANIGL